MVRFDSKPSVAVYESEDEFGEDDEDGEEEEETRRDLSSRALVSLVWRQVLKGASLARKVVQPKGHGSFKITRK